MLYMGFACDNCQWGGGPVSEIGIVGKDSAFNEYKRSINNWGTSYALLGESMAHEIAHQQGIHHDNDSRNGDTGNWKAFTNHCNGKGLISLSHHLGVWSSCSKAIFEAYYTKKNDNWYAR